MVTEQRMEAKRLREQQKERRSRSRATQSDVARQVITKTPGLYLVISTVFFQNIQKDALYLPRYCMYSDNLMSVVASCCCTSCQDFQPQDESCQEQRQYQFWLASVNGRAFPNHQYVIYLFFYSLDMDGSECKTQRLHE